MMISESDGSDDEYIIKLREKINHMQEEEKSSRIVSKNEKLIQPIDIKESKEERQIRFKYQAIEQLKLIGRIDQFTKQNIIIQSMLVDFVVDLDQILYSESQEILGNIDDVFGKIERPMYSIIIDSYTKNLIEQGNLRIGDQIFINERNTQILDTLRIQELARQLFDLIQFYERKKGCDASNQFDEEVLHDNEREYSDDELEQMSKLSRKSNKTNKTNKSNKSNKKLQHKQFHDIEQIQQQVYGYQQQNTPNIVFQNQLNQAVNYQQQQFQNNQQYQQFQQQQFQQNQLQQLSNNQQFIPQQMTTQQQQEFNQFMQNQMIQMQQLFLQQQYNRQQDKK